MHRRSAGAGRLRRASSPFLAAVVALVASLAVTAQDRPRRGGNAPLVAVKAGTIHPVSGPAITNGVVLIRGSRIVAVGAAADVEIPAEATVLDYPTGHVYPGFVDALSTAFGGDALNDGTVDAGAKIADALDAFDPESQPLAAHGVTTAYVSNRSGATWRGQGALVRPTARGYAPFPEHATAGVHLRLTTGPGATHPLMRLKQLEGFGKEFEQLEAYEKGFADYKKQLEEYEKKFEEYLAWHRKKSGMSDAPPAESPPADAKPATENPPATGGEGTPPAPQRGEGRRGRRGGGGPPRPVGERPPEGQEPPAAETPANATPADAAKPQEPAKPAETGDKEPERPKRPTEPKHDLAKDAWIALRDGKLTLFVEAHRPDEIERALAIVREREIDHAAIELATGAAPVVDALAAAGVPVILDGSTPPALDSAATRDAHYVGDADAERSVAAALAAKGVPFAFGSGAIRRARQMPTIVAAAIGDGVPTDVALRAVTLTPAEILGVADRVGSLEPRKLADLVVTSGPLEASDARILRVLSAGNTVHEASR